MTKRLFDLIVATLGLVLLALPGLLVALAIRLDSPGPGTLRSSRVVHPAGAVGRGLGVHPRSKNHTVFSGAGQT